LTGSNGFPVIIAAADSSEFDANWLYITYCADATCTTSSETKIPGPPSHNQFSSPGSVAAGWLADGTLFVAHQGSTDACTTNDFIGLWGSFEKAALYIPTLSADPFFLSILIQSCIA
jgi:hypothetical protein